MTRQQRWAKGTFEAVRSVADAKAEDLEKKYATHCMKAPSLLRQAGLVQTLAFLRTRGDAGKRWVDDLARVLAVEAAGTGEKLQQKAQQAGLAEYIRLTRDAMGVAVWLRRFAQAELKQEET